MYYFCREIFVMAKREENNKNNWLKKLRDKYRLVIVNENTFEDKYNIRLSRLNVFIVIGTLVLILTVLNFYMIAYTPLKEYIPGFANVKLNQRVIKLQNQVDSLNYYTQSNAVYIRDIKRIISGGVIPDSLIINGDKETDSKKYDTITYRINEEDSLMRVQYEKENAFSLFYGKDEQLVLNKSTAGGIHFFPPINGIIIKPFNALSNHYGSDIVAKKEEPIKAIYDGTVIFSEWTLLTGYVIIIQHPFNYLSVYKHNSVLLKKEGERVHAGEPIAIIGESGELSTGPHLHFEIWHNGIPLNPEEYINF